MDPLVNNFYKKLTEFRDSINGDIESTKRLTQYLSIVNTRMDIHYDLLGRAILELTDESSKVLDVNILVSDKIEDELALPIEILSFRLGKTFGIQDYSEMRTELLNECYYKYTTNNIEYWIHKDSDLTREVVDYCINQGFKTFDNMMMNSFFGQIYYERDKYES